MKTLIPVSPKKKFGHYDGCKMDYPKNLQLHKTQPKQYQETAN
jgi:hypothetical protein